MDPDDFDPEKGYPLLQENRVDHKEDAVRQVPSCWVPERYGEATRFLLHCTRSYLHATMHVNWEWYEHDCGLGKEIDDMFNETWHKAQYLNALTAAVADELKLKGDADDGRRLRTLDTFLFQTLHGSHTEPVEPDEWKAYGDPLKRGE